MTGRRSLLLIGFLVLVLLSCRAAAGLPNPFATATPTATSTFTPSPTPTLTLTPTPIPSGVITETLADGSTHFIDYDAGYELQVSKGWTVVPIDAKDIQQAMSTLGNNNPDLRDVLDQLNQLDPNTFRLFVFDTDPAHFFKGFVTNINIMTVKDKLSAALPMDMILQVNLESINSQFPSAKVISHEIRRNTGGVEIGILELTLPLSTYKGASVIVYEKQCYINARGAITIISFATPQSIRTVTTPAFDLFVDSIRLLSP